MPSFPKPKFAYAYDVGAQVKALRAHKQTRGTPGKNKNRLLVATWNIANLGARHRRDQDHRLIAEILSWYDVIAVQECVENFGGLFDIVRHLGGDYRVLLSDATGNNERMVFVYDAKKLTLLEEVGEVAFPPSQFKHVKFKGVTRKFDGFDRTPYLATFQHKSKFSLLLVNVHLFFGSAKPLDIQRRALETVAVARWAAQRKRSQFAFTREVVALGDFNMPKAVKGNIVFDALTSQGLEVPGHSSEVGSAIASDNHYDQIAFFPDTTRKCFLQMGVYDYDGVIFKSLWDTRPEKDFKAYCRSYMSDHRPMWFELQMS